MNDEQLAAALGWNALEREWPGHPSFDTWRPDAEASALGALRAHGDFERWSSELERLPDRADDVRELALDAPRVSSGREARLDDPQAAELRSALAGLGPWRKGPFDLYGVELDAEWNCSLKWRRVAELAQPFAGRRVLDVGAGNGYYSLRLLGAGAAFVAAVEPSIGYTAQYLALARLFRPQRLSYWPLPWERWATDCGAFDSALSLGVLYHRRDPLEHLRSLGSALRPGGELVLETLVLPDAGAACLVPSDRYARMRNVWAIPSLTTLSAWLSEAGFEDVRFGPLVPTTSDEQRSTEWSPGPSLRDSLAATDAGRTIEGHPAPLRVVAVARKWPGGWPGRR
ncbi:MAG TPA: tRNA 5-methoxyuridine(34)/uridine 5-oxyacetic acid(34) synthase CmoB [Polyangiaceae bacterium]|nr:tRNA 5-methoxyuridine(34)/uridine 5-oxyacetic acid(34) synthase CmoB [Polyangiaceae bacterium]